MKIDIVELFKNCNAEDEIKIDKVKVIKVCNNGFDGDQMSNIFRMSIPHSWFLGYYGPRERPYS